MRVWDKTSTPKAVRAVPVPEVVGVVGRIRTDETVEGGRIVRINMADLGRWLTSNNLG